MNLLEVDDLCKTYGSGEAAVRALKNVSFSVPKGEYVAVVGESGSGKSTLLNMIGGLDAPTSGRVMIGGKDIVSMNDRKLTIFRRRNIGFIFQAFNLIPELTALRFLVGEEFSNIPLFGISITGIISGAAVGIITVLIAASSPAKRAAKVSPVTAVSGNSENTQNLCHTINTDAFKIETALGVHHAVSAKKNLLLMTGSFALSIILFLSFLVLIDFVGFLMPQSSSAADISISSNDGSNSIDSELPGIIKSMEGVKRVFGRRSILDIPAAIDGDDSLSGMIDIISYDEFELDCLSKDDILKKGSHVSSVYGNGNYVLATWDKDSALEIGDKIWIKNEELTIAGLLKYDPFSSNGLTNGKITLITSGETFTRLTGIADYSLLNGTDHKQHNR